MSSSDPPQLRLSLPQSASTFKRSFDQFGFDLDTPLDPAAVASTSVTDEHRPGPSNGDRNKRARSNSVTPNSADQSQSMDSTPGSSSSHTISSGSSSHAVADHRDAPPQVAATRYSQTPETDPVFPSGLGGELNHASGLFDTPPLETSPAEPSTTSVWSNSLSSNTSTNQNDQFRLSMERFHAFDSQISSIRARPTQLPFRVPSNPPTLPPLTASSPVEHSHSHISPAVSLPSVESLGYPSTSAQASTSAPPLMALSSTTSPDQHRSDISPLRFEELGEFREMMGFYHERNPNSPSIDRPIVRRRHQSPPLPDNSERSRINPSFGRSPANHVAENISRNPSMQPWPSDRRNTIPDNSDDDFYGRPVVTTESRESLDLPRSRLDSSLLANRIRRSMENPVTHPSLGRVSPPLFSTADPSSVESSSTHPVNGSRTQEPGRHNRHEAWSFHSSSRLPVFAEAFRTLTGRLGRPRQRTGYASERRVERSQSPGAGAFSSSASAAHYAWPLGYPEFTSSEDSPYELDLAMPSPWSNDENATPRQSIPTSRVQRDTSISRQVPWRNSLSSNDTSEDRLLSYLTSLHRPSGTATTGEATQPDSDWRRPASYTDYHPPYPPSTRTSSGRGGGANNTLSTRESHATEHNTLTLEVGPGWWRSVPRAEPSYGAVHEHDTSSVPNASVSLLGDRPPTERPPVFMRDFVTRHPPQAPSRIPPHDQNARRSSEIYQSVQSPEVGGIMATDTEVFSSDESSEVPFSSHAAALIASRATSSASEVTSQRRPDTTGFERITESSYYPWTSRFERDITFPAPRRNAGAEERRQRNSPELERSSTTRRFAVAEHLASSDPAHRSLDIEEFQHGPFRATLERLERQERQDQMMMERQAEIDRLRLRLDELQSQERPTPSTRAPTLPPLRFDTEYLVSEAHRMPSPTPSAEASSSFRADLEAANRRRSWQRGRGTRPSWLNPGDESAPWRSSSGLAPSIAPLPIPRAHSPPHPLPDSRNARLAPERDHERRRRPGNLELWSPGDADDAMESLTSSSVGDGSYTTRSFARMRGEFQSTDGQQARREPRGNPPWSMDPGRPAALREPHADALRGIRPLWAAHPPVPWGMDARDEIPATGSGGGSSGDAPVRGRRRRVNQSALPPQGRNVSEDERPPGSRRASSTSRYAAARRARDPVFDRFQRMVRGSPREGGFYTRYSRRNPGDFVRDEDFDESYESLLSLAATIGEVRPRHTPDSVIDSLPTGMFKEWRNAESDQRCPICLDDYQEDDAVMRLSDCPHWLHKGCLQQWLRGATTCPVCRQRVRCPQPARRDRGARVDPQGVTDRRGFDFAREIHEVRIAFPDINGALSRPDAGPGGSGSEVEREIEQEVGDVVDMSLDWELAGAI